MAAESTCREWRWQCKAYLRDILADQRGLTVRHRTQLNDKCGAPASPCTLQLPLRFKARPVLHLFDEAVRIFSTPGWQRLPGRQWIERGLKNATVVGRRALNRWGLQGGCASEWGLFDDQGHRALEALDQDVG